MTRRGDSQTENSGLNAFLESFTYFVTKISKIKMVSDLLCLKKQLLFLVDCYITKGIYKEYIYLYQQVLIIHIPKTENSNLLLCIFNCYQSIREMLEDWKSAVLLFKELRQNNPGKYRLINLNPGSTFLFCFRLTWCRLQNRNKISINLVLWKCILSNKPDYHTLGMPTLQSQT